jgi:prophage antirepressor-like protein
MSNIIPFSFEETAVRVIDGEGGPWFVLADVCAVLDISKYRDAAARLDDDERGSAVVDTLGGPQKTITINESGLYNLIFSSRKESAQRFRKWVTAEVLPTIRKTGQYKVVEAPAPQNTAALADFGRFIIEYADRNLPNLGEKSRQVLAARVANSVYGEGTLPLPRIEEKFYTTTEIAKEAGITPARAGRLANVNGLKVPENGEVRLGKASHSEKHVEQWYWNERGKMALLSVA